MNGINLLDWRTKKITILNRRFFVISGAVALACALLALCFLLVINSEINTLTQDSKYIDGELQGVEGKIKEIKDLQTQKDLLLSRRKIIETLQASRPLVVKIFDNIVRAVPPGVVLSSITRKNDELVLSGDSDTNNGITTLMQNVQHLDWVKEAKIGEIKTSGSGGKDNVNIGDKFDFQLHITINAQNQGEVHGTT